MISDKEIFNKVEAAGILRLDLREFKPLLDFVCFDIAAYLDQGIIREKPFIEEMDQIDWSEYSGKAVSIDCSQDAIIPQWVYMAIGVRLSPFAASTAFGAIRQHEENLWAANLDKEELEFYYNKKVVVVASPEIPFGLYLKTAALLEGKVTALMYGEQGFPKVIMKYKQKTTPV